MRKASGCTSDGREAGCRADAGRGRAVRLPLPRKLAGLRYVQPRSSHRRVQLTQEEVEERARDAGFANEREHQRWRWWNGISGPVARRSS